MSSSPAKLYDAPIIGTDGNDLIAVESSVSFRWVPGEGNAHLGFVSWMNYDTWDWNTIQTTGPSTANGYVTFDGVASSQAFQVFPTSGGFSFTNGAAVGLQTGQFTYDDPSGWSYDPATGVLDPLGTSIIWDNWIGAFFMSDKAVYEAEYYDGSSLDATPAVGSLSQSSTTSTCLAVPVMTPSWAARARKCCSVVTATT